MNPWEAFVAMALPLGELVERRSRYADKPALVLAGREVAHSEASGLIDLRITRAAWKSLAPAFAADPCVVAAPGRRDWVELRIGGPSDLERLQPLVAAMVAANR